MEQAVQIFAAINFLAVGVSHVVQHEAWRDFFVDLHARGTTGNFFNAMLALGVGSLIFSFHRVWSGIPLLLTLYGIAATAKGALYLVAPKVGLSAIRKASEKDSRLFVIPGLLLMVLGGALVYHLVR